MARSRSTDIAARIAGTRRLPGPGSAQAASTGTSFVCSLPLARLRLAPPPIATLVTIRTRFLASSACRALLLLLAVAAGPARAAEVAVKLDGVKGAVRDNVMAKLSIAHVDKPTHDRVHQLHAQATQEIQEAMQPFGYYKPTVDAKLDGSPLAQ